MDARAPLRLLVAASLMAAAVLLACTGGEPDQAPGSSPTATNTATSTTTSTATSTATPTSAPTARSTPAAPPPRATAPATPAPSSADIEVAITRDTTWQDLFDTLSATEQSCMRAELGAELQGLLARALLSAGVTPDSEIVAYSCLAPATAHAVIREILLLSIRELGFEANDDEVACLEEALVRTDIAALVAGEEDDTSVAEFTRSYITCMPDVWVGIFASNVGLDIDELSEAERACLRDLFLDAAEDISSLDDSDLVIGFLECVPSLADELGGGAPDDRTEALLAATPVTVGESVDGVVSDTSDSYYFTFEAEQGVFYEIDVALGTLSDSVVTLYDHAGELRDVNDDHGDSFASRITWEATYSGTHYIEVYGYDTGSYTLTVSVSEGAADEGARAATTVVVGTPVGSVLDHDGDLAVFVFDARQGQLYQVDVLLGTLPDSAVAVYDPSGNEVAYNDDYADSLASRVWWEAPVSGSYRIEVWGYGTGTFTLALVAR
jgi:hypothetical protein